MVITFDEARRELYYAILPPFRIPDNKYEPPARLNPL